MIVTGKVQNVATWCSENISAQVYYLPSDGQVRIGGTGWQIRSTGTNVDLYCADETLGTFLALKYGLSVKINPKNTS